MKGLTFDEMPKRWGWTRSASPRHSAAWCVDPPLASFRLPTPLFQAKLTPEELNLVGILDDGADSPTGPAHFFTISAPLLHPPPLMYFPSSRTNSTAPALIAEGVSTPRAHDTLSTAPAWPLTAGIARCTH
ncbi:hypothetical protein B0H13DRAFT_2321926 [Mycena leptocephala]|nr:hypothetical protein B0H13DRAFT_2321926 [Mycena leptocephala]